jgi:catalase-peroxidase
VLEPKADGFRNYIKSAHTARPRGCCRPGAKLLTLTAPEMTVLVGGLRVLGANGTGQSSTASSPTGRPADNDFFVNLLDMGVEWERIRVVAHDRKSGASTSTSSVAPTMPSA